MLLDFVNLTFFKGPKCINRHIEGDRELSNRKHMVNAKDKSVVTTLYVMAIKYLEMVL